MSLFVGNISRNVRTRDLEDEFDKFGPCSVNHRILTKGSYAFIEFEDERDAEDAMNELQDKNMGGLRINIEWSKRSGRYDAKTSRRPPRSRSDVRCFACGKFGHFARECHNRGDGERDNRREGGRDGGREGGRDGRDGRDGGGRYRREYKKYSRSVSRSKSRSRSRSSPRYTKHSSNNKRSFRKRQASDSSSLSRSRSRGKHEKERRLSHSGSPKHKRAEHRETREKHRRDERDRKDRSESREKRVKKQRRGDRSRSSSSEKDFRKRSKTHSKSPSEESIVGGK